MDPDLQAEYAKGFYEPNYRAYVDLSVKGDGVNIEYRKLGLNPDALTHYRNELDGPIGKISIDASVYLKAGSIGMHTWNAEGKHADIFYFEAMKDGEEREEKVDLELDGKVLHLEVNARFYILEGK